MNDLEKKRKICFGKIKTENIGNPKSGCYMCNQESDCIYQKGKSDGRKEMMAELSIPDAETKDIGGRR